MEIIELTGYTEEEKVAIATRYLIPRQTKENGIDPELIEFPQESIAIIARNYTREAGVRKLEQQIGTICRKLARRIAEGQTEKLVITPEIIHEFLGGIKVRVDTEIAERTKRAGVAVGLAWTPAGGDVPVSYTHLDVYKRQGYSRELRGQRERGQQGPPYQEGEGRRQRDTGCGADGR